jgi:predicted TIM-barrel fold metal-dependent hydrolase
VAFQDAHVHLNDVAMQLALMDEHGVGRAVVFWGAGSDNALVAEAAARHPGRFIPFASVSPERRRYRDAWTRDDPALLAELESLLATGRYHGIGEINVVHDATARFAATDFSPTSPTMRGILALARKHRVPVLVHCEAASSDALGRLLDAYPDVPVIWAHGGYTGVEAARAMLARHPNLYYELSARTWPRHPRSRAATILGEDGKVRAEWLALIERSPQRFLVGTDASHRSAAGEAMKHRSVLDFLAQLSAPARAEVAGGVLERLVGAPKR